MGPTAERLVRYCCLLGPRKSRHSMKGCKRPRRLPRNIKAISELEHSALAHRSISARIGDSIASHAGKMWFIVFHVVWFSLWLWLNGESKSRFAFDPFPYQLLSTIVSLESIFLSLFTLMSQNRSNIQADS